MQHSLQGGQCVPTTGASEQFAPLTVALELLVASRHKKAMNALAQRGKLAFRRSWAALLYVPTCHTWCVVWKGFSSISPYVCLCCHLWLHAMAMKDHSLMAAFDWGCMHMAVPHS